MTAPFVVGCVVSCAALLVCERRDSQRGIWLTKPAAAACFVAAGLASGALGSGYGRFILLGLLLSWLGDVLLIPRERPGLFLAGIASFLLAHLAYCGAFATAGLAPDALFLSGGLSLIAALGALAWLRPSLSGLFARAVPLYIAAIASMLALAGSATALAGRPEFLVGAGLFAVSDLFVARDRFVAPGFLNAAIGLPLYFAGQLVLATSV